MVCNLQDLLILLNISAPNIILQGITLDSRKAKPGDLFLAIKGYQVDGRRYIDQAITQGVVAVIAEAQENAENGMIRYIRNIPIVYVYDLNKQLSLLAAEFYQYPAKKLLLIGVTGTNGKTTTTHFIAQWAKCLGETSGVMGTLGNGLLGEVLPSKNTTCSAVDVQDKLQMLVNKKATLVAMEVSSHGLMQNRVTAIFFTVVVFTNLSHDHLDYHGDMKNYTAAKWSLFSKYRSNKQVINVDDDNGLQWLKRLPQACAVSIKNRIPDNWRGSWVLVKQVIYDNYGAIIYFNSTWGSGSLKSPLVGSFNINNVMLAMASLLMIGYPLNKIIESSYGLQQVCGRMEIFNVPKRPTVVIDYAHTPDALKKVLSALRFYCRNKLWCIFGCGGDRDRSKRALMGRIAEQYADIVMITDDNPRNEDPKAIISDILSGFIDVKRAIIISGRMETITNAIMKANINDIILIAGKGHENYQIIGNCFFNYSDRLIVKRLLQII